MNTTTLIASLGKEPSPDGCDLRRLPSVVRGIEVCSAGTDIIPAGWLRQHFSGELIFAEPVQSIGERSTTMTRRHERLMAASLSYDLVELDAEFDLTSEVLEAVPAGKRIIGSYRDATDRSAMIRCFEKLAEVPARYYKFVLPAQRALDALAPLQLLQALGRSDVIAYASGEAGVWSRMIAPHLGSPLVYGAWPECPVGHMEPTVEQLKDDYDLPNVRHVTDIYGIIGESVFESPSPLLHNAAYRELGIHALFVPFPVQSLDEFWNGFVESGAIGDLGFSPRGFTVASPFKEAALSVAQTQDDRAGEARSANVVYRRSDGWRAATTDPQGVLRNLERRNISSAHCKVAVIGCGGSGRAIAAALREEGADVTLVNRSRDRGQRAVRLLRLPFVTIEDFSPHGFDILVNATPVGRAGESLPFDLRIMGPVPVVVDLVYGRDTTPLIAQCRQMGGIAIDGRDVLLAQVACQFRWMTGYAMPDEVEERLLGRYVEATSAS